MEVSVTFLAWISLSTLITLVLSQEPSDDVYSSYDNYYGSYEDYESGSHESTTQPNRITTTAVDYYAMYDMPAETIQADKPKPKANIDSNRFRVQSDTEILREHQNDTAIQTIFNGLSKYERNPGRARTRGAKRPEPRKPASGGGSAGGLQNDVPAPVLTGGASSTQVANGPMDKLLGKDGIVGLINNFTPIENDPNNPLTGILDNFPNLLAGQNGGLNNQGPPLSDPGLVVRRPGRFMRFKW